MGPWRSVSPCVAWQVGKRRMRQEVSSRLPEGIRMPRWVLPAAPRSVVGRVGLALLAVGLATLVSLALNPLIGRASISPYLIAVLALARFGGLGPSLIASVLSVLAADFFLFEPRFVL